MVGVMTLSDWLSQTRTSLLPEGILSGPPAPSHAWHLLLLVVLAVVLVPPLVNTFTWLVWIVVSIIVGLSRAVYSAFVVAHVAADIWLLSAMKTVHTLYRYIRWCVRACERAVV